MPRLAARPFAPVLAAAISAAAFAARPAAAQLLLDPAAPVGATTTAITGLLSDPDDGLVVRPFADGFTFYGVRHGSLVVTSNGYLHFGGDASYARSADRSVGELAAAVEGPTVAPLYDDLVFDESASLLEHVAPGQYQAYTYAGVRGYGDGSGAGGDGRSTFQVAFFTGATRIGAVDFLAGDVAFSYGALAHAVGDGSATVGVARDAATYTAAAGGAGGAVTSLAEVPAGAGRFVLLRPNAGGGYDALDPSALITVPEPSSAALLAAGLGAVWAARRRRRA